MGSAAFLVYGGPVVRAVGESASVFPYSPNFSTKFFKGWPSHNRFQSKKKVLALKIFEFFYLIPAVLILPDFFDLLTENKSMSSIGPVIPTNNTPGIRWHMVECQVCFARYGVLRHLPNENLDLWRDFEVPYLCPGLIHRRAAPSVSVLIPI